MAFDDLHIAFFAFLFLCEVDLIGDSYGAALEQVGNEFVFIHLISGALYVLYDIVQFRDGVGTKVFSSAD